MFRFTTLLLFLIFVGISSNSCTYYNYELQPCNTVVPDSVSFSIDILPIFNTSCNNADCHSGAYPTGNLNLEDSQAYQNLSHAGSGYINVTVPKHSILYSQLVSSSTPMPPGGKLEQCQIDLILKWIEQGAKNN
jgi:hypothetical protein